MPVLFDANFLIKLLDPQIDETKSEDPQFIFLINTLNLH
jgi:hypothetical protein